MLTVRESTASERSRCSRYYVRIQSSIPRYVYLASTDDGGNNHDAQLDEDRSSSHFADLARLPFDTLHILPCHFPHVTFLTCKWSAALGMKLATTRERVGTARPRMSGTFASEPRHVLGVYFDAFQPAPAAGGCIEASSLRSLASDKGTRDAPAVEGSTGP